MADLRSLDGDELVQTLVVALRRSLVESCDDHESMARAYDIARAASLAIASLEDAACASARAAAAHAPHAAHPAADGGEDPPLPAPAAAAAAARRARADALRQQLVAAIYGVHADDMPALLHGDDAAQSRAHIDAHVDVKALERVLCSCLAEVERATGAALPDDPVEHFLSGAHAGAPGPAPGPKRATPVASGIRLSVVALVLTTVALTALLVHLSIAFAHSLAHPATHIDFRDDPALPLPVLTFCPSFAGVPLFPLGGDAAARDASPAAPAPAAAAAAPTAYSTLPLVTIASVASTDDASLVPYPRVFDDYAHVVDVVAQSTERYNLSRPYCPRPASVITRAGLGGRAADPVPGACVACLRVGARTPFTLRKSGAGEDVVRVKLAVNRMLDFCMFPAERSDVNRVTRTFAGLLASRIEALRDGGFLEDPTGMIDLAGLSSADVVNSSAVFLNFDNPDSPYAQTSDDRRRLEADFFCNALFLSGVFYPVANVSMRDVAYEWSPTVMYWRRKNAESDMYWDVSEFTYGDDVTGEGRRASVTNLQVRSSAWEVYADDSSAVKEGQVASSSFVGSVEQLLDAKFRFRRRRGLDDRIAITAPIVVSSFAPEPMSLEQLFRVTTLEFTFDRYLTEEVRQEVTYLTHQYLIDMANAVSLFLGVSVHSLVVAPVTLYIHARLTRRR